MTNKTGGEYTEKDTEQKKNTEQKTHQTTSEEREPQMSLTGNQTNRNGQTKDNFI